MNDKELIARVRLYKAMGFVKNYYQLAQQLGISEKALYNWLGGYYSMSYGRKQKLNMILLERGL